MTKSEIEDLEKRVTKLAGPETPEEDRAIVFETDLSYRVLQCLTDSEKRVLADVLIASDKERVDPNEVWLSNRSQDEQAVVRKVLARFRELTTEGKST